MDEGFPDLAQGRVERAGTVTDQEQFCELGEGQADKRPSLLNQRRALSVVVPPRPISNRVVKHHSAAGTGGIPAGRQGPRAHHQRE